MEKIKRAVFDAGPLIHLDEINQLKILKVIKEIFLPDEVYKEFKRHRKKKLSIKIHNPKINSKAKGYVSLLMQKYELDLGEAEAIALAKQERINLFFTDDWCARDVAEKLYIETHGVIGIVFRAYRENLIDKKETLKILNNLLNKSSLFITKEIIEKAKKEIKIFNNKKSDIKGR